MTVRYLIVVDIQTSGRRSTFQATILDSKNRIQSGKVSSESVGKGGASLSILSRTESEACSGLGQAVYNFITSEEGPAPANAQ